MERRKVLAGNPVLSSTIRKTISTHNTSDLIALYPKVPKSEPRFAPAINTYGPRLKSGETGLVHPHHVKPKSVFVEESESESSDEEIVVHEEPSPKPKPKPVEKKRYLPKTRHDYSKYKETVELLVPIRIEFDVDGYKIKDCFIWNLHEKTLSPERFGLLFALDLGLPEAFVPQIATSIKTQIQEFKTFFAHSDIPPYPDSRITIRLDISSGKTRFRDRFEWDVASGLDPEEFARITVSEMHLGGEFISLIAHSIREQIYHYRKNLMESSFAIEKPMRSEYEARSWTPVVESGVNAEEEEEEQDRATRRMRREARASLAKKPWIRKESGRMTPTQTFQQQIQDSYKCVHCKSIVTVRSSENNNHLCTACGLYLTAHQQLPVHRFNLFQ